RAVTARGGGARGGGRRGRALLGASGRRPQRVGPGVRVAGVHGLVVRAAPRGEVALIGPAAAARPAGAPDPFSLPPPRPRRIIRLRVPGSEVRRRARGATDPSVLRRPDLRRAGHATFTPEASCARTSRSSAGSRSRWES